MVRNFQFLNKEDIENPHSSTYKAVEGEVWPSSFLNKISRFFLNWHGKLCIALLITVLVTYNVSAMDAWKIKHLSKRSNICSLQLWWYWVLVQIPWITIALPLSTCSDTWPLNRFDHRNMRSGQGNDCFWTNLYHHRIRSCWGDKDSRSRIHYRFSLQNSMNNNFNPTIYWSAYIKTLWNPIDILLQKLNK